MPIDPRTPHNLDVFSTSTRLARHLTALIFISPHIGDEPLDRLSGGDPRR